MNKDLEDPIDIDADYIGEDLEAQNTADDNYDDGEIYDENWDEAEVESLDSPPPKNKKKGGLFNILLIGGAVAIGGIILVTHFAPKKPSQNGMGAPAVDSASTSSPTIPGDNQPPPMDKELAALKDQAAESSLPPATAPSMPQASSEKGFMDNPEKLEEKTGAQTSQSLPENGPSMTGFDAPTETATANPSPNLPSIDLIKKADPKSEAVPALPAAEPAVKTEPKQETAPLPPAKTEIVASTPESKQVPIADSSAHEKELQAKLDDAMSHIDDLEKQLAEKPVVAPVPAPDNSEEVAALKNSIAKLQDQIAGMKLKAASMPTEISHEDPAPVEKAPVVKKHAVRKKKQMPASETAAFVPEKMELRSARTGEAMIGKSGQSEFRTVHIGDVVSGIGQIKSIMQVNGVWVVQGTTGAIGQ